MLSFVGRQDRIKAKNRGGKGNDMDDGMGYDMRELVNQRPSVQKRAVPPWVGGYYSDVADSTKRKYKYVGKCRRSISLL